MSVEVTADAKLRSARMIRWITDVIGDPGSREDMAQVAGTG
jgi:hypothetical protein